MSKYPEETIQTKVRLLQVDSKEIERIKGLALNNQRRRIRINAHHEMNSGVHEMIIVHCRNNYVRPHRHKLKTESFHIIEGELDVIIFDDLGNVIEKIVMGPYGSSKKFYYRCVENVWHTVIPKTQTVVFHETTNGPFSIDGSEQAPWAPDDKNTELGLTYLKELKLI